MENCTPNWLDRTTLLLGEEKMARLRSARILVAGLGGVGGYAVEQLCRAGIGHLTLVDADTVSETNLNRQIIALGSTIGKEKVALFAERCRDINPEVDITPIQAFLKDEAMMEILHADKYDVVVDAIDTLSPKVFFIYHALQLGFPVVSSMGSAGKLDPGLIRTVDISKTYNCHLARMVRKRLHRLGVNHGVLSVFSPEPVDDESVVMEESENKASNVGSISYIPPVFGCHLAAAAIRLLLSRE